MPKYVNNVLKKFNHNPTKFPQYSPNHYNPIVYGKEGQQQFAPSQVTEPNLPKDNIRYVQSMVESFLYYARAIDCTMLPALNKISKSQANPTQVTLDEHKQLLDYANTYQNVSVRYRASAMIRNIETDAAYLVLPKAKRRLAGYYYMGHNRQAQATRAVNGAILVECKTIDHVVASAAEAETAGLFHNTQHTIPIRRNLIALGHPQPPTPIKTDNSTAHGFTYEQKISKSWDMRYYWLRDRQNQQQLDIFWEKGTDNNSDYFTEHDTTLHHRDIRSTYVHDKPGECNVVVSKRKNLSSEFVNAVTSFLRVR